MGTSGSTPASLDRGTGTGSLGKSLPGVDDVGDDAHDRPRLLPRCNLHGLLRLVVLRSKEGSAGVRVGVGSPQANAGRFWNSLFHAAILVVGVLLGALPDHGSHADGADAGDEIVRLLLDRLPLVSLGRAGQAVFCPQHPGLGFLDTAGLGVHEGQGRGGEQNRPRRRIDDESQDRGKEQRREKI